MRALYLYSQYLYFLPDPCRNSKTQEIVSDGLSIFTSQKRQGNDARDRKMLSLPTCTCVRV